jgi:type II secretory pathway pseudopilin PulG
MTTETTAGKESGFSLVEAIIAVLVFIIGIAAISNLFLMSMTANSTANVSAATASVASEVLDRLRALPSNTLTLGAPTGGLAPSEADSAICSEPGTTNCVVPGNFVLTKIVPGVGIVHAKWSIAQAGAGLLFITVQAQTTATVVGERGNAVFTTFRY